MRSIAQDEEELEFLCENGWDDMPDYSSRNCFVLVIENAGYVEVKKTLGSQANIEYIFVVEEERRQGYASALIKKAEEVAKKRWKVERIQAFTDNNTASEKLFMTNGYAEIKDKYKMPQYSRCIYWLKNL